MFACSHTVVQQLPVDVPSTLTAAMHTTDSASDTKSHLKNCHNSQHKSPLFTKRSDQVSFNNVVPNHLSLLIYIWAS